MSDEEKKDKPKKEKPKANTMDIKLINSAGQKFIAYGDCSDKEFKSICRALTHSKSQDITLN